MKNRKSMLSLLVIAILFLSMVAGAKNVYAHSTSELQLQAKETVVGETPEAYTPSASTTYVSGHEVWETKTIVGDVVIPSGAVLTTNGTVSVSGTIYVYGTFLTYGSLTAEGITGTNYFSGYSKELQQGSIYNRAAQIRVGTLKVVNLNLIRLPGPSLTSLEIIQNPTKLSYIPGEAVDRSGLLVQGNFSDGSTNNLTHRVALREYDHHTTGEKDISILIENRAVSFKVKYAEKPETKRLAGSNRYRTAVEISKTVFNSAATVILVSGENFPEALAGAPLSGAYNAPILLTGKDRISDVVLTEIKRLGARRVILLGGENAISDTVARQLAAFDVERISGSNRTRTAISIGDRVIETTGSSTAILVNGYNFPDALSVGPAAAIAGQPILFTETDRTSQATLDALMEWGIEHITIIGGTMAVGEGVADQLKGMGYTVDRVQGANRYRTALAVAETFFGEPDTVVIASGENFPDAMAGAPLAMRYDAPVLLVQETRVAAYILDYLTEKRVNKVFILGGNLVISDSVMRTIEAVIN